MKKTTLTAIFIVIAALLMCLAGCSRNGYGCKGRGKIITRVAKVEPCSWQDQFNKLQAICPTWDSLKVATAINED